MIIVSNKKRFHTTYPDGLERVDEYTCDTDLILLRKWKQTGNTLHKNGKWEYEIGQENSNNSHEMKQFGLLTNANTPIFLCFDTPDAWEWRIRNLPYEKSVYALSIEGDGTEIVLRTTNKKYFKRFQIPEMCRRNLKLEESSLSYTYSTNTLLIQYDKPDLVLKHEDEERKVRKTMGSNQEGSDVDCKQQ